MSQRDDEAQAEADHAALLEKLKEVNDRRDRLNRFLRQHYSGPVAAYLACKVSAAMARRTAADLGVDMDALDRVLGEPVEVTPTKNRA